MGAAAEHVAILGAGPTGLEAALACVETCRSFSLYEAAPQVAGNVRAWGHVSLFTPWDMVVSPRMARQLAGAGLEVPAGEAVPTGAQLVDQLLEPVADLPSVAPHLRLGARVVAIGRQGLLKHEEIATPERGSRPFRLLVETDDGEEATTADVVLDCTGTYHNPNPLGDGGIPAPGERALGSDIVRQLPDLEADAHQWAGRKVLLAGAGASAQTAARSLAALVAGDPATEVVWAVRDPAPTWGAVADDPLPARASLVAEAVRLIGGGQPRFSVRTGVEVERLERRSGRIGVTLRNGAGPEEVVVDKVLALTGYVGDQSLYRQLQVHECYATAAPMDLSAALLGGAGGDCLAQVSHGPDVLRNPEPNFFILGMKSYGRVNQYLMRIGWEQVDDVVTLLGATSSA
ncbi:MAG: flavoprotein [Actinobacteria bacterium]|nr:flavoprotein [Actinomycetota bacterium]MBW3641533.1 flavoprotein [Actinomycetota bacterium]